MKKFKELIILAFAMTPLIPLYYLLGCPLKFLTGVSCIGCGMTRAWEKVMSLDFGDAFYYHPCWPIPLVVLIMYFVIKDHNTNTYKYIIVAMIILFVAVYIFRLLTNNPIIEINPSAGIIFRIMEFIKTF